MDAKREFLTSEMMADRFAEYCRVKGIVGCTLTGAKAKELWQVAVDTLFLALISPTVSGVSVKPWAKFMIEKNTLPGKRRAIRVRRTEFCNEHMENPK